MLVDLSETVGQPLALDEVRFGRATEDLVETPLPVQEVASLLGYSDPGNFTHAFNRWAGQSPSDFGLARRLAGCAGRSST